MTRLRTTLDFIALCNENQEARLSLLANELGFNKDRFIPYEKSIQTILDFVDEVDLKCHEYGEEYDVLPQTFHLQLSSDLRSIIILGLTYHNFQINIVLRHFIEVFVIALWVDICSDFTGGLYYFINSMRRKPNNPKSRICWEFNKKYPSRSIKQRLERIRMLNDIHLKGKRFYRKYLNSANEQDIQLLLSLPVCEECKIQNVLRREYKKYRLTNKTRGKGKEDPNAVYKTDYRLTCSFCYKNKSCKGYIMGVPEPIDMIGMLKEITNDMFTINIGFIQKIYGYLSDHFVHFSTLVTPDKKPTLKNFGSGNATVTLWGFEGVVFCLNLCRPLLEYYFNRLKSLT